MAMRPVVPHDLLRIRFVSDPQISPDGSRVAFVVTTLSDQTDEYLSNIWVVDTTGGEPRRFTTGPNRDTAPRWSPDGTRLAFVSERVPGTKAQLFVMPSAGGEPVRLTNLKNGVHALGGSAWAPDGTRLVFSSRVDSRPAPEGEGEGKAPPARVITTLKHKFDGEGFTFDRRPHVFVVDAAGSEPRQITDGDYPHTSPAWSSDGRWIAFVSERHETRDDDWASDVWLAPSDGGEPRRVTATAGPVWHPSSPLTVAPSPTSAIPTPETTDATLGVYVRSLSRDQTACVTEDLDRPAWDLVRPVWSADAQWILFVVRDRGAYPVYRVRATGGEAPAPLIGGRRTVNGLSVAAFGGKIAFTATDPLSPTEVFVCNADGTGERQLTDLNRAWKAEVALSRPEHFRYERAGFEIDGWVLKPADFDPARRYPGLLVIHGGPHREFGDYYSHEFQVCSGSGLCGDLHESARQPWLWREI